jgi:AAA domain
MGLIEQIQAGRQTRPRRALVYGVQGVGKSTFGASSRRPVFIATEDGLAGIDCERFPLVRSYGEVAAAIASLLEEEHDFGTVVVDSLDWLERVIWDDVCSEFGVKYLEKADGGYGKGYTYTLSRWRNVLDGLDALRDRRHMAVILIAHAKAEKFQTPENTAHDRFAPRLHKLASALVQEWCDEVFFATYSAITDPARVKTGEPPERVMRTCEGPTHVAKNRLNMPPELPLEWAAYDYYANLSTNPIAKEQQTDG